MNKMLKAKHFAYMESFVPSYDSICGLKGRWQVRHIYGEFQTVGKLEEVTCKNCIKVIKSKLERRKNYGTSNNRQIQSKRG